MFNIDMMCNIIIQCNYNLLINLFIDFWSTVIRNMTEKDCYYHRDFRGNM